MNEFISKNPRKNKTIIIEDCDAEYVIVNPTQSQRNDLADNFDFFDDEIIPHEPPESKTIRVGESLTWKFPCHGSVGIFI